MIGEILYCLFLVPGGFQQAMTFLSFIAASLQTLRPWAAEKNVYCVDVG
jgi:hypothetical protein